MRNLIVGNGEVGKAIAEVLECEAIDIDDNVPKADIIHICFPYSKTFNKHVTGYTQVTGAKHTVIHSTVPVGTSSGLGAVHSPVRGRHPDLADSIRCFVKFFGGPKAEVIADMFWDIARVRGFITDKSENTEAMKLWSTEQYRTQIKQMQEIWHYCEDNDLDFRVVYTAGNDTYNTGYKDMNLPQFKRPLLTYMGDDIGGHCVEANHKIIKDVK